MRIGIDMDGVLSCFNYSFVNVINEIWPGRFEVNPPDEQLTTWHWPQKLFGMSDAEVSQVWERVKQTPNFWSNEIPYQENVESLWQHLNDHPEDQVFYITSRVPTTIGPSVMEQTYNWLLHFDLIRPSTAVLPVVHNSKSGTPPKNLLFDALGLDDLLDDYLPTVKSLEGRGTLLDRAWNRDDRGSVRVVGSMKEFLERVNERRSR